jgi:hypothetical protein
METGADAVACDEEFGTGWLAATEYVSRALGVAGEAFIAAGGKFGLPVRSPAAARRALTSEVSAWTCA